MAATNHPQEIAADGQIVLSADDVVDSGDALTSPSVRSYHWTVLVIAGAIIVASFLLEVTDGERVRLRFVDGVTLPQTCYSRALLNIDCPGCGLTRSLVSLAQADLPGSLGHHGLGWAVAILVISQIPYRMWALRFPDAAASWTWLSVSLVIALFVAIWVNWAAEKISHLVA